MRRIGSRISAGIAFNTGRARSRCSRMIDEQTPRALCSEYGFRYYRRRKRITRLPASRLERRSKVIVALSESRLPSFQSYPPGFFLNSREHRPFPSSLESSGISRILSLPFSKLANGSRGKFRIGNGRNNGTTKRERRQA